MALKLSHARCRLFLRKRCELAGEIVEAFTETGLTVEQLPPREALREQAYLSDHVLLIDRMLEGTDSLYLMTQMRACGSRIPVIVILSLSSVGETGSTDSRPGDDNLVKPSAIDKLLARVEALRLGSIGRRHAFPPATSRWT